MSDSELINLPQEMVVELALGFEPVSVIAKRHDYDTFELQQLMTKPWLKRKIQETKDSLTSNGFTFQAKMAMLAESLLVDAWKGARMGESVQAKLEVGKYLSKLADLEPKANSQQNNGPAFSITIKLPGNKNPENSNPEITIDHIPTQPQEALPPRPEYIAWEE